MAGRVFVVTGSNKGIGYGIVRGLGSRVKDGIVYLTARNESLGQESLKRVISELGDKRVADIRYHQLDITDEASCRRLAEHLMKEHDGLDVLINNAEFAFKNDATDPPEVQADVTIGINYYGTKLVSDILIPLIRPGGRVVNVCSQAGVMGSVSWSSGAYSQERVDCFRNPNLQVSEIDDFVEDYKRLAREGKRKEGGFPESAYRVSKAAEIALTMAQARQLKDKNIVVNACCPGFVDTDMTSHKGHLTIDQGADTPIYLATDSSAPHGEFVYQRKALDWLAPSSAF
ncbi:oxidoreductaseshort chain dehydrogenase/reductase family protein [Aphelenchoides avenae]|nr:oxidoreductaseshort chain dehydrogenase/reductase family protein [Aphelenchus avenae]